MADEAAGWKHRTGYVTNVPVKLSLETDAIADAARELLRLHQALAHRHGEPYRKLERRIEALPDPTEALTVHDLGDANLLAAPPKEWIAILTEGRALGVI